MQRFFIFSLLSILSLSFMGCQFFQQPKQAEEVTETSTATITIEEPAEEQTATSTGSLTITESPETNATANGTLEITAEDGAMTEKTE